MTKDEKIFLLRFITATGMYVWTVDKSNIVSYIHGYEEGAKTRGFSNEFERFIEVKVKFKIRPTATGWPGQVEKLSKKLSQNWVLTFNQTVLQFITDTEITELEEALNERVKKGLHRLIERLDLNSNRWIDDCWVKDWQSLCLLRFKWFKQLWTPKELKIVKAINEAVTSANLFSDNDKEMLTKQLLEIRHQYRM